MIMLTELGQFVAAHKLVDQLLYAMLISIPGAARIRLGLLQQSINDPVTGTQPRYDVTNIVTAFGRPAGPPLIDRPLADWGDFLPELLAGQCALVSVGDLKAPYIRNCFEAIGAATILACPALDASGSIIGAILIFWDGNDHPPKGNALRRLMVAGLHLGTQVAAIFDLQRPNVSAGDEATLYAQPIPQHDRREAYTGD
jgi:hypothetical protein